MESIASPKPLSANERSEAFALLRGASATSLVVFVMVVMLVTIVAVLKFGAPAAYLFMSLVAAGVCLGARKSLAIAIGIYLAYCGLDGMFRYATSFSVASYLVKPALISLLLFYTFRSRGAYQPPHRGLVLAFLGLAGLTVFHPLGAGLVQGVAVLTVWYATPVAMYFVGFRVFRTLGELRPVLVVMLTVATIVSLFAIFQFKKGEAWCLAEIPGYKNVGNFSWMVTDAAGQVIASAFKPASTTSFGGSASGWAQMGVVMAATMLFWQRRSPAGSFQTLFALAVNFSGLVIGGVRSTAIVGLLQVGAAAWLGVRSTATRIVSICLMLIFAAIMFFWIQSYTETPFAKRYADTLNAPLQSYGDSRGEQYGILVNFLWQHPLGIGYQRGTSGGTEGDYGGQITASRETQLNAIAADMGLPGLVLLAVLLWAMGTDAIGTLRLTWSTAARPVALLFCLVYFGVILACATGPALQGNDFFWFSLGALFSLPRLAGNEYQLLRLLAGPARVDSRMAVPFNPTS